MTDTAVSATNGNTTTSTEQTVVNGDAVTTITKTKTVRTEFIKDFFQIYFILFVG